MVSDPNANIQRNEVEAKQGTARPKLYYVLAAGLVLVIAAFVVVALTSGR